MELTGRGFICVHTFTVFWTENPATQNHLDGVERQARRCYFPKRKLKTEDERVGDTSDLLLSDGPRPAQT